MTAENFFGICNESTEYLDEFRRHVIPRDARGVFDRKSVSKKTKIKTPQFSTSYDTLQKLDFTNRLTFDALWPNEPKTVGLNYRVPFCIPTSSREEPRIPSRKKPLALANPAADVDQVDDSELRKTVLDYTYKTWKTQDAEEVWQNWIKTDLKPSTPDCDDSMNLVTREFKLFPDLPAGFKAAAKKWDSLQDRTVVEDEKLQRRVGGTQKSNETAHDHEKISELIDEKKMCSHEKSESPDGADGTSLADRNDSEKKNLLKDHSDLVVSQTSDVGTSTEG